MIPESFPLVVVALIALVVVVLAFAASRYKVAKPNEALIIAGSRRSVGGIRVVVGGGAIVYPLVNVAKRISLEVQSIGVGLTGAVTSQGVPVAVEGIVNVKIADDEDSIRQAAQRFLDNQARIPDIVRNVMEGSLRTIIGQLTVEQLIQDREVFASRVQEVANSDLEGTGLAIDVFIIQSIADSEQYIENLGRRAAAEVRRDAEIAEASTTREAREKQEAARQAILEAEKATRLREQSIRQEVASAEARADQSKPLAEAEARKEVVLTETEVAELVARRRDRELDAEIRRTADAERYAAEQRAEAARYAAVAEAEARAAAVRAEAQADRDRRLLEAEAERANLEAVAAGNAYQEREIGVARADATRAVGEAEADAMAKKAESYKQYEDAATLDLLVSRLPEVARAVAEPIGHVGSITVIDTDGANKITQMASNTMHQIDAVLESFTGSSLSTLIARVLEEGSTRRDGAGAAPAPPPAS
ncbi:MAG TPA: SPFH domain-containing protein [Actinomycetota bacterium]|nr:SPFH domain-containing protein [Actinomycetota bacterium]